MKTFADYGINYIGNAEKYRTTCPKCSHERVKKNERCLSVNTVKGVWFCFHCGRSGNLKYGWSDEVVAKEIQAEVFDPDEEIYGWFAKRGISEGIVDYAGLSMAYVKIDKVETKCIAFPYFYGDKIVNYKYRSISNKRFTQTPGASINVFYNINSIIDEDVVVITEGEVDALSVMEAGIQSVVSVPSAPPPESKELVKYFAYLDNCIGIFEGVKKIYLALDKDAPGIRLREELARRFGKQRCYIVDYITGCKDINDVLVKYGKENVRYVLENARPYPVEGVFTVNNASDELNEIYKNGYPDGVKTGWSSLDDLLRIHPGMLTVITGIPNHGKSPFLDNLCMNIARNYGWKIAMFSPENGGVPNHAIRLIRQYTKKHYLPCYYNRATEKEVEEAKEFINQYIYFVLPKNESYSVDVILDRFEYLIGKQGIRAVVIDPYNTLEHQRKSTLSETEYIGLLLNKFKYFAQRNDVHFFIVAHPIKMKRIEGKRIYEVPNMYSISQSANWYNVPDNGMTVYRQYSGDLSRTLYTRIYVQKVKFDWVGRVGSVKLYFDVASQTFNENNEGGDVENNKNVDEEEDAF